MIATARQGGWRVRDKVDRYFDRRDVVDFTQVIGYALLLLAECLRSPAGEFPTESELRQFEVRLYPAPRRIVRGEPPSTLLNIFENCCGDQDLRPSGITGYSYLVMTIAVALPPDADLVALRKVVFQTSEMIE